MSQPPRLDPSEIIGIAGAMASALPKHLLARAALRISPYELADLERYAVEHYGIAYIQADHVGRCTEWHIGPIAVKVETNWLTSSQCD